MKNEKYYACEEDYVESAGELHELTVTITLNEYRALIREAVVAEAKIERLEAELEELRKEKKSLSDALAVCKMPAFIEKIAAAFASDEDDEESDADDEIIAGGDAE